MNPAAHLCLLRLPVRFDLLCASLCLIVDLDNAPLQQCHTRQVHSNGCNKRAFARLIRDLLPPVVLSGSVLSLRCLRSGTAKTCQRHTERHVRARADKCVACLCRPQNVDGSFEKIPLLGWVIIQCNLRQESEQVHVNRGHVYWRVTSGNTGSG